MTRIKKIKALNPKLHKPKPKKDVNTKKENVILYNPAKGLEFTDDNLKLTDEYKLGKTLGEGAFGQFQ